MKLWFDIFENWLMRWKAHSEKKMKLAMYFTWKPEEYTKTVDVAASFSIGVI